MPTMTLLDRSLYYKGLLLLVRKDGRVSEEETELMLRIGRGFGFEEGFCRNALADILVNKHIEDAPSRFSTAAIARCFIRDGITVGYCDHDIHHSELAWLRATAEINGLDFEAELAAWRADHAGEAAPALEAEHLRV